MNYERIGILLAAGGERVIAWQTGVLAGLLDGGIDPRRAAVIGGTSAGSLVAARMALGADPRRDAERLARGHSGATAPVVGGAKRVAEVMQIWLASRGQDLDQRRRRIGEFALTASALRHEDYMRATAARLPAGSWPAALRLATVDARSGARVVLDADAGVSVAHGVSAARAVPGVRPPVAVGGRALIDAALGTATNADLLCPDVESLVIVTASPAQAERGTLEGEFAAGLATERHALDRAGVSVTVVRATGAERAAMGDDLFSAGRAGDAAAAGREHGRRVAAQWRSVDNRDRAAPDTPDSLTETR